MERSCFIRFPWSKWMEWSLFRRRPSWTTLLENTTSMERILKSVLCQWESLIDVWTEFCHLYVSGIPEAMLQQCGFFVCLFPPQGLIFTLRELGTSWKWLWFCRLHLLSRNRVNWIKSRPKPRNVVFQVMKRCGAYRINITKHSCIHFRIKKCVFIFTMGFRLWRIPSTLWEARWVVQMCISLKPLSCWRSCSLQYFPLSPTFRSVLCGTLITSWKSFIESLFVVIFIHGCIWGEFSLLDWPVSPFNKTTEVHNKRTAVFTQDFRLLTLGSRIISIFGEDGFLKKKTVRKNVSFSKYGTNLNFNGSRFIPENPCH